VSDTRDADVRSAAKSNADPEPGTDDTLSRTATDLVRLARLHNAYGDPTLVDVVYLRPPSITLRAADKGLPA
jgi:hypothetical protein